MSVLGKCWKDTHKIMTTKNQTQNLNNEVEGKISDKINIEL